MGEIKSAWELAMEKVDKLGKLSPEELRQHKEDRCREVGEGLAERYLAGLPLRDLKLGLGKSQGEERGWVVAAASRWLVASIELGDTERLSRVMEALEAIGSRSGEALSDARAGIEALFEEYREANQKRGREVEVAARGVLHQLRISGSAIDSVNPEVVPGWKRELDQIARPYHERLSGLKASLAGLPAGTIAKDS